VNIDINVVAIKDAEARSRLAEQTDGVEEKVILAADSLVLRVRERILG
jgi:formiminotetrahydrofolate cyclodeaminase